jgi:membrane dipeptidase
METPVGRGERVTTATATANWTIVDAHGHALDLAFRQGRHLNDSLGGTTDVPSLRAGGVTVQLTAMWIPDRRLTGPHGHTVDDPLVSALRMFDYLRTELDGAAAGAVILVRSAADISRAKEQGKVALLVGMEGTDALADDLAVLRTLYQLGLRHVGIVHERRNAYGTSTLIWESGTRRAYDPALDPPATLTEAGRELIAECDRLGILVDLTHLVDEAFYDALGASERPVIVSHAGSRALRNSTRYLADAQVRAVASSGGVVCASPTPLGPSDEAPGLDLLLNTIDHFVKLVGADHVGIGTDFKDQFGYYPHPFTDSSRTEVVAEALFARGYRDTDVEKIMGGSVLRVIRAVLG